MVARRRHNKAGAARCVVDGAGRCGLGPPAASASRQQGGVVGPVVGRIHPLLLRKLWHHRLWSHGPGDAQASAGLAAQDDRNHHDARRPERRRGDLPPRSQRARHEGVALAGGEQEAHGPVQDAHRETPLGHGAQGVPLGPHPGPDAVLGSHPLCHLERGQPERHAPAPVVPPAGVQGMASDPGGGLHSQGEQRGGAHHPQRGL
mmetsp:Transcript_46357/g.88486  ORF Transcript_46357/g.88486 Transcript_46357/m.88486 type:complete len:204 (+) Transcript_46357:480-1091(+)